MRFGMFWPRNGVEDALQAHLGKPRGHDGHLQFPGVASCTTPQRIQATARNFIAFSSSFFTFSRRFMSLRARSLIDSTSKSATFLRKNNAEGLGEQRPGFVDHLMLLKASLPSKGQGGGEVGDHLGVHRLPRRIKQIQTEPNTTHVAHTSIQLSLTHTYYMDTHTHTHYIYIFLYVK